MPNERIIPSAEPKSVVTFTILSENNPISGEYHILSVIVNKEVNRIPSATITLLDGSASEQTFKGSNNPEFEPGKQIEIKVGYRKSEATIFNGIIIRHSLKVRKNNSVLIVECRDKAIRMTGSCKSRYFKEMTDSDIIEEMIGSYGIDHEIASTNTAHKQVVQFQATDWDFMLCRCEVSGMICLTNDNVIKLVKPALQAEPALTISYGATILDLDVEIDARLQYKKFSATTWDYATQEIVETEAADAGVPAAGNLSAQDLAGVVDDVGFNLVAGARIEEPELQEWVDAKSLRNQLAKIRGRVRVDGIASILPGQIIQLNGIGERFEGKLFVSGVRHEVQDGSWTTVFQVGSNPEWFVETFDITQPSAAGLLPPVEGLQIGVVTQLQDDPDGEHRIQVRLPTVHKDDEGIWYRLATLDAGNERGTFFLPEIDDEVIVGFINNDPRHGVVLGMLHSSAKPAPLQASDDNHEKGYQSRSKIKLLFDDDKKSVLIETPGGNKINISDDEKTIHLEDQNGNKIVMDDKGITIESSKAINLKAGTDLKAEAGANVTVKGGSQTKIEGGSGAELSSGGTTNVKGSMVNIN